MGFRHRKLMDEAPPSRPINSTMSTQTINSTVSEFCEPFCDPLVNESGYCISPCLDLCPTNCHYTIPPPQFSGFPPPPPPPPSPSNRHVSPLLITTFVALSLAFFVVLGYVVCSRRANRGGRGRGRNIAQPQRSVPPRDDEFLDDLGGPVLDHPIWYIHTIGLPPSVIGKIPVCRYKGGEGLIEGTECSVCLTEFEEDESLRLLPKCSHAFHIPCIDTWLRSHTNCPNCRAPIVTSDARSPSPEPINDDPWEEIRLDRGSDDVETTPESQDQGEAVEGLEQLSVGRIEDAVDESKNGMMPIRRSVSVDSLSAAKINLAVAGFLMGKSRREDARDERFPNSSNIPTGQSVQCLAGSSSSMKRSLSWSGRFLASKYSRNRSSLLPL